MSGFSLIWQAGASNKSQLSPRSSSSPRSPRGSFDPLLVGGLSDLRSESLSVSHRVTLLENEIRIKDSKIDTLNAKIGRLEDEVVAWRGRKSGTWVSSEGNRKNSEVTIGTSTMSPSITSDIDMSFTTSFGEEIQRRKHEIHAVSHTINGGLIRRDLLSKSVLNSPPSTVSTSYTALPFNMK